MDVPKRLAFCLGPKRNEIPQPARWATSLRPPDSDNQDTQRHHPQFDSRPIQSKWSTFPKPAGRTASPRNAGSTPSIRSPSTRLERPRYSHRESVVTTVSRAVTVVKRSLFSGRRQRRQRKLFCGWSAQSVRPRPSWL
ncbi:hypothetical protein BDDG_04807 [Blastomyces dermatitidis ATCC 18188]|uniref:Uncharacterized protein n=1 Tax=Ajellomyces dermatitidis (strain ATCC 18188 / CBS 674.68) TaxID=653446 RepID=F2TF51_AJEDA|nr:hypothetical protein BDDG_04807 [Blastomyces dermatitidis ATCC 18188]